MAVAPIVVSERPGGGEGSALEIRSLDFSYPGSSRPDISDVSLTLPRGSRCILVGENGAGKTTLLQLMGGHHMVGKDVIRIIGRPAFHDTSLLCSGDLSYLGTAWRRDVAFAGYGVALQGDFSAGEMIRGVEGCSEERRERLIKLLKIDESWRMIRVSDGERRRVQICMGLLKPYVVLLLDEITVDLDIVGRLDLLNFFKQECEERNCTIIYATHIFDGLEPWITHYAYLEGGKLTKGGEVSGLEEMKSEKLLYIVEGWLRKAREAKRSKGELESAERCKNSGISSKQRYFPNKHMAFYR